MALKEWMMAFNDAKEMEADGKDGHELITAYQRVLDEMGEGPFTEAEEHVREEVLRNLEELYSFNGDEEKAKEYSGFC